jgi:hypothetical protein
MTLVLVAALTATAVAPATADDDAPPDAADVGTVIEGLDTLTEQVERATRRAERRMDAGWDLAVALAVDFASLTRLERTLAVVRVRASAVLEPLIGVQSTGAVPAAITAALWNEDMNYLERRDHDDTLSSWRDLRRSLRRALGVRDELRRRLGLPSIDGLRTCPLEETSPFRRDWGDRRGWWRTHKGTDLNAGEGARLVAMERGEIIQMGWHYLGGNGLYLRGAATGDVYYYAHLSGYAEGIEVGLPVEAGQLVGYVGSTGNADVPHLHLGWMPGTGKVDLDALADAYPMLVELCL